jgi:putative membrane-bound dehydrogenase-like protein
VVNDSKRRYRSSAWVAAAILGCVAVALIAQLANVRAADDSATASNPAPRRVKVLFLGDHGHHDPLLRLRQIYSTMGRRGIDFTYTDRVTDLNPETLNRYDELFLYANITTISPSQEKALLDFVESGHGFVPVHCGSACFGNSPKIIALMGAKFDHHSTGVFKETIVQPDHAVEKGLNAIESWDETYSHSMHNEDGRTVLAYRTEGDQKEPWTWVRNQGKGRVFYTAWGHDDRTWSNADFQNLIERGIKWAAGDWALESQPPLKPFTYSAGKLPNYLGGPGALITKMQDPIDVAESMKHMAMAPGFEPKFFAGEPDIKKPICMAFDERGRLWVSETFDYPNEMQPAGQGHDRITICEDTKGTGVADKFTVFADKLSIPTSMVFANGGVIISQAPDMLFLKDTSGTGMATERRTLFSGWGTRDTHAGPSNLHWGLDGWIYGSVGYSGFDGEVGGERVKFAAGMFRFKPDGSKLEFLGSTNNNTWGVGISEDFELFASTANHNPEFYLGIPNRYFETVRGWAAHRPATIWDDWHFFPITDKVRQVDQHGGYTAGAGAEIYTARTYPEFYWNHVNFVTEPTGHLIGQFALERLGSGYLAVNQFSLFASTDEWTAPIAATVGPDGQVWMIDWYNIIVQHNPTPQGFKTGQGGAYVTEHRDHRHGRVYRLVYKDGKPSPILDLSHASPEQLVEALKSDNMFWRNHAQRLLVERGNKDVIPALVQLIGNPSVDAIGLNPAAIHALWAIHDLNGMDDPSATAAAVKALSHKSAGVRKNALMVVPRTAEMLALILKSNLYQDPDVLVRKAALLATSEMPVSEEAGAAIYRTLAASGDANLSPNRRRTQPAPRPNAAGGGAAARTVAPLPNDTGLVDAAVIAAARHDAGFLKAVFAANPLQADAHEVIEPKVANVNLIENPSFEKQRNMKPIGWSTTKYGGDDAKYEWADIGHTGKHSVMIHSGNGVDAGWLTDLKCEPNTDYILSGWIKTEGVAKVGNAAGALLNLHIHQLRTNALVGTHDWTKVELKFNSGSEDHIIINCLFGGWGRATGTAWYDDIELVKASATHALPGTVGQAVAIISNHYAQRGPTESIVSTLSALKTADAKLATAVIDGLAAGWPEGKSPELAQKDVEELQSVMKGLPAAARDRMLVLGTRWGRNDLFGGELASIAKEIKATLNDEQQPAAKRVEAAKRLLGIEDNAKSIAGIVALITPASGPDLQAGLIDALSSSRTEMVGDALVKQWKKFTPASQRAAAAVMIRKPAWASSLLAGIDKGGIDQRDLANEQWQALTTYPDERIARKARMVQKSVGRAPSEGRKEIVARLIGLADKPGDVTLGKEVFTKNCMVCHTLDGQGGKVGPELTGVGARPKSDILMQILDPNRSVEGTYREWTAKTNDGDFVSGRLMTETTTTVELLDTTGKLHLLQRKDLKGLTVSEKGLMPEGFEVLKPEELSSVLEYLATSKVKH